MKKSISVLLAGAALVFVADAAQAADWYAADNSAPARAWYLRGDVGIGISRDYDYVGSDQAVAVGGGLGYRFTDLFRADVTYDGVLGYSKKALGIKATLDTHSVMANGYADLPISDLLRPYVGIGVGYGWTKIKVKALGISDSEDGLALAGMAGVTYNFSNYMVLDVGYKFRNISIPGQDVQDHMIRAGARFYF